MHPVFEIPELVLAIYAHLDKRPDQLCLMLLCETTFRIVVEEMWRDLYDHWQIMDMIPKDVKLNVADDKVVVCATSSDSYIKHCAYKVWQIPEEVQVTRPLTEKEWSRLRLYLQHVRHLKVTESLVFANEPHKPSSFSRPFLTLSTYRGEEPLLASLNDVELDIISWFAHVSAEFLIARPLRSISLVMRVQEKDPILPLAQRLLDLIAARSSRLESLRLERGEIAMADEFYEGWEDLLATLIGGLKHKATKLRKIDLSPFGTGRLVIPALASLDGLKELTLTWAQRNTSLSFQLPNDSFQSLTALKMNTEWSPLLKLLPFLENIHSNSMERINVLINQDLKDVEQINRLVSHQWSKTLTHYHMEWTPVGADVSNSWDRVLGSMLPVPFAHLVPLLECHQLQRLSLPLQYPWDLTDDRVGMLVRSLPNLWSLELASSIKWTPAEHTPATTIRCLELIAAGLPYLKYLTLDINLADPSLDDDDLKRAANPRIRRFHSFVVGNAPATIIKERTHKLFPGLTKVVVEGLDVNNALTGTAWGYKDEEDMW
ncbi:hypothetical protein DACRYDRAFT_106301 [Dacryopinax primogenitus]|uniref:F-box domain-containing protein n=1 Tax=Dacryopinax primogenitus (strain DJM 731) TaxID=1858805 RepID=M5GEB3_DACPD|nr:uncharacterized protein DACRYDRAFT_106301 [Dacryopinax primogenitus]EJU03128.1 hypothetical protein DACRYDRAFT_106301 [Dacryopinax primogenitus]